MLETRGAVWNTVLCSIYFLLFIYCVVSLLWHVNFPLGLIKSIKSNQIKYIYKKIKIKYTIKSSIKSIEFAGTILLISTKTKSTHSTHYILNLSLSFCLSLSHTITQFLLSIFTNADWRTRTPHTHTHTSNLHQIIQRALRCWC